MRKHLHTIFAVAALLIIGACSKEEPTAPDSIYLYTTAATVDSSAGSHSLTIYTTCAWHATADNWITLTPNSGDGKGISVVKVTYGENTTGAPQTGRIVFHAGAYTQEFSFTQKQ